MLQARTELSWQLEEADLNMSHHALLKYLSHEKPGLEYEEILYTIAVLACRAFLTGHGLTCNPACAD